MTRTVTPAGIPALPPIRAWLPTACCAGSLRVPMASPPPPPVSTGAVVPSRPTMPPRRSPAGWFRITSQPWVRNGTPSVQRVALQLATTRLRVTPITSTQFGTRLQPGTTTFIPAAVNTAYFCAQCHDRYFNNTRLRNATDASVFCGAPVAGVVVNGVTLPVYADADGVAPWIHPTHPTECQAVTDDSRRSHGLG